jgi:streptogramin lyase
MTKIKFAYAIALLGISIVMIPASGQAAESAIRGKFAFDGIASCENPPVQNFPVHAEGTATLTTDRSATLDMVSNIEGAVQYNAKLSGKPSTCRTDRAPCTSQAGIRFGRFATSRTTSSL